MVVTQHELAIDIGGMPILVRTDSAEYAQMLADRYGEFVTADRAHTEIELEIKSRENQGLGLGNTGLGNRDSGLGADSLDPWVPTSSLPPNTKSLNRNPGPRIPNPEPLGPIVDPDADLSVRMESGRWILERGDFRAEWDPETKRGWVRTSVNPYSIDGVLRVLHSLILAREGGLLVHGASAVRNGKAFVFAGVSGAGKTTISSLAPPDVTLLTDEISYLRGSASDVPAFTAFGTPFAGELARIGVKTQAPLARLFLLQQGPENRIEPVTEGEAVRELMRHILFFAHNPELVESIFGTVCNLVKRVPVRRMIFKKDASVWELVR